MCNRNLVLMAIVCLSLGGCVKDRSLIPGQPALLEAARHYFTDSILPSGNLPANYVSGIPRKVHWEQASPVSLPVGSGFLAPVEYEQPLFIKPSFAGDHLFHLDNLTQLLVYRDADKHFHAEVLTWMPDSNFLAAPADAFSGFLFIDDWWGNGLSKWLYGGGQVRKYHASSVQAASIIRTCNYVYGYNYAQGDPGGGYAWVQAGACYDMYLPDRADYGDGRGGLGSGSGGGGGLSSSGLSVSIASGNNPIADIADYFKCFTNVGGSDHRYEVTVYIDQPLPGTRSPWVTTNGGLPGSSAAGNVVDVGHVFLGFTEQYGGSTITRNVGFYPAGPVNPIFPSAQGMLNNDERHTYNISATFTITNAQFFIMLNYISKGNMPGFLYNINSENCTTYALQTLAQGGVNLPNTIGMWARGSGNDPGDLGEDIRQMNMQSNMTRSTVEFYHPNIGTCN